MQNTMLKERSAFYKKLEGEPIIRPGCLSSCATPLLMNISFLLKTRR